MMSEDSSVAGIDNRPPMLEESDYESWKIRNKVKLECDQVIVARNKRNAKLEQETELLKTTLRNKEATIASLTSETKTVLSEKKTLEDKYLEEIVCLKNANQVATSLLQKFQLPTQTIPMLSKRPMIASNDIHKTVLGLSNPWFGRNAQLLQPTLYDGHRLLQPGHALVTVSDSHETLLETEFVPQKELSREQVYWLYASDIASQSSDPPKPGTPFIHTRPVNSEVHTKVWKIKECLTSFEDVIKKHTAPPSDDLYHREYNCIKKCFDEEVIPFFNNIKQLFQLLDHNIYIKVKEFERIFDELDSEYEQTVLANKNLQIEKKYLLIKNECLIFDSISKDICSIMLASVNIVPHISDCMCAELRTSCDREHNRVLELEAENSKLHNMLKESEKRCDFIQRITLIYRRGDWAPPTPRKKHVTFQEPPEVSTTHTKQPAVNNHKQPNVNMIVSTRLTPAAEVSKPLFMRENHKSRVLPTKNESTGRVEDHPRNLNKRNNVNSSLNDKCFGSVKNAVCGACNKCLVSFTHDKCYVRFVNTMNAKKPQVARPKTLSKNVRKTDITVAYRIVPQWKSIGRQFILCDIYGPKKSKAPTAKPLELSPSVSSSSPINVISSVYYVEGLSHNLFLIGQFCDGGLEVALRQHTCHIRNMDKVHLLQGSRTTNLYSILLNDILSASPVCLLTKASSTKSWLWHRRLNHLNFGTLNELARNDLVRGLPLLKYDKDHLCTSCQLEKSKKVSHPLKTENSNKEILSLLHMDLCRPMRTESINKKRYVLVIMDDYTRFGWVRFLRTKDETPAVFEKYSHDFTLGEIVRDLKIRLTRKFQSLEDDAKKLLEAVEKRFGGNAATKKTQRNLLKQQYKNFTDPSSEMLDQTFYMLQKFVSQLELLEEKLSREDFNQKLLRSLSPEWNTHVVVWRNRDDLDTMSMDDLFKNSRYNNTSSTNRAVNIAQAVNTAHGVSIASTQVDAAYSINIDNLNDAIFCSIFASQPNSPQLVHEDLEQIHPYDIEEMDLRCQVAMFTIRARRALRNQDNKNKESLRRSMPVKISTSTALVSCDGLGGYEWSDQAEEGPNFALVAFSSSSSDSELSNVSTCSKSCLETVKLLKS
nr:retrovirus-related Pol polyprotein from transposon TNT 1-94 [Tanacetum cinerariifolium]